MEHGGHASVLELLAPLPSQILSQHGGLLPPANSRQPELRGGVCVQSIRVYRPGSRPPERRALRHPLRQLLYFR